MLRVLVWSNDPIGAAMAGPGIRYLNFAHELSRIAQVTLVAPNVDVGTTPWELRSPREVTRLSKRELAGSFDVIVAQSLPPAFARRASLAGVRLVFDLYAPALVEPLAHLAAQPGSKVERQLRYDDVLALQRVSLAFGDAFLCASERQRDLWLGALGALGRLSLEGWERDRSFEDLIAVVPFGLDPFVPEAGTRVLKGVVPGIGEDDRVLLWGGGIWNWLDPVTVIEAVGRLARERDDVRLVFLGVTHPSSAVERMTVADRALGRVRELDLDGLVFFNPGWVPYDERHRYLLEADLGVSAHFDSLESRFAFRTRLLDCFWCSLPVVCTGGDVLGELVGARGLGRVVPERDVEGWALAIRDLLDDDEERARARTALDAVREEFVWERVCEPLREIVRQGRSSAGLKGARGLVARAALAGLRSSVARRGVGETLRVATRSLRGRKDASP